MIEVDLFGFEVDRSRRRPGRPRHMPTPELRAHVRQLHLEGLSHLAIAAAIGVTDPTLRIHYFAELDSSSQTWRRRAARDENLKGAVT